jgi:hypothetical protein
VKNGVLMIIHIYARLAGIVIPNYPITLSKANPCLKLKNPTKKPKDKNMSPWNKMHNRAISKRRFVIEHTFGRSQTHLWFSKNCQ